MATRLSAITASWEMAAPWRWLPRMVGSTGGQFLLLMPLPSVLPFSIPKLEDISHLHQSKHSKWSDGTYPGPTSLKAPIQPPPEGSSHGLFERRLRGRLPWTELARHVEGLAGSVDICWEFSAGDRFGRARPFTTTHEGVPVITVGDQTLAVISDGLGLALTSGHTAMGSGCIRAGERQLVCVVGADCEPVPLPSPSAVNGRIDTTIESWRRSERAYRI